MYCIKHVRSIKFFSKKGKCTKFKGYILSHECNITFSNEVILLLLNGLSVLKMYEHEWGLKDQPDQ